MSFEIGDIHPNTPHLFADLAELLLISGYIGRKNIHKNDLESLIVNGTVSSDEIDEEEEASAEELRLHKSSAEKCNRPEIQLEDVLSQLEYRSKALKDYYPFQYDREQIILKEDVTDKHRVYKMLLACSRLRSFGTGGVPQRWAKHFALLSKEALMGILPSHAITKIFDANSDDRKNYYSTNLPQALRVLGKDLGVLAINEVECDKASTSGDAGFDLIATVAFNDGAATNYAILGQCGAQETGWPDKSLEAHSINCRNYFQIQFDYPSVMFTPVCYREVTGEWVSNANGNGILLVDRMRMLSLIESRNSWTEIVNTSWFSSFEHEFVKVTTSP